MGCLPTTSWRKGAGAPNVDNQSPGSPGLLPRAFPTVLDTGQEKCIKVVFLVAWDGEDLSRGTAEKPVTKLPVLNIHLQDTSHSLTHLQLPLRRDS